MTKDHLPARRQPIEARVVPPKRPELPDQVKQRAVDAVFAVIQVGLRAAEMQMEVAQQRQLTELHLMKLDAETRAHCERLTADLQKTRERTAQLRLLLDYMAAHGERAPHFAEGINQALNNLTSAV